MSKTKIPPKVKRELWFAAHGRCEFEGCNKALYEHGITMENINLSNYAHIVADSPNGPRGNNNSKALSKDPNNLMLLCRDCHALIDNPETSVNYSVERLKEMKRKHEERIKIVTSISPTNKTYLVTFVANIGESNLAPFSYTELAQVVIPEYYPSSSQPIDLGVKNSGLLDNDEDFWKSGTKQLDRAIKNIPGYTEGGIGHISLFPLAPQPLLVYLGTLLNDKYNIRTFQKHREPDTWRWEVGQTDNQIHKKSPRVQTGIPVLIIALSSSAINKRIRERYGDEASIWTITCKEPNNDMLRTESQLSEFRSVARRVMDEINTCATGKRLQIYMSMPAACAVELGRIRMSKADIPWDLYDKQKDEDVKVLTIE